MESTYLPTYLLSTANGKGLHLYNRYNYFLPISCHHDLLRYFLSMNNPKPIPEEDFETNLENNLGKRS